VPTGDRVLQRFVNFLPHADVAEKNREIERRSAFLDGVNLAARRARIADKTAGESRTIATSRTRRLAEVWLERRRRSSRSPGLVTLPMSQMGSQLFSLLTSSASIGIGAGGLCVNNEDAPAELRAGKAAGAIALRTTSLDERLLGSKRVRIG